MNDHQLGWLTLTAVPPYAAEFEFDVRADAIRMVHTSGLGAVVNFGSGAVPVKQSKKEVFRRMTESVTPKPIEIVPELVPVRKKGK